MRRHLKTWPGKSAATGLRRLTFTVLVGLFVGFTHLLEPVELVLEAARIRLDERQASGTIALVAIDDRTVAEFGPPPWNGGLLASLIERTRDLGARSIHIDAELPADPQAPDAGRLEAALESVKGRVTLPTRVSVDEMTSRRTEYLPPPRFSRYATLVNTNFRVEWDGTIRDHPYSAPHGGQSRPSLASRLSGRLNTEEKLFPIDFRTDPGSVPTFSAGDVLAGRIKPAALADRSIVIARTDLSLQRYWAPGRWLLAPGMLHILAAETLLRGQPLDLGWFPPLLIGSFLASLLLFNRHRWVAGACLAIALFGSTVGPMLLGQAQIYVTVLPGLSIVIIAAGIRAIDSIRRSFHVRGTTNLVSGLPNLQALSLVKGIDSAMLVVARTRNYAQIIASLQPRHEKELVEQIVARLSFGTHGATIYQLDEGVFVWVASDGHEDLVIQQIEGLHALFRSPIVIDLRLIDLTVTFGLDVDSSRPILQRLPSALVAADTAAREGKRWANFNPAALEDAEWKMSLLARLDHAINSDELWIAYQPKLDLRLDRITGAEALVRWTHPEKGQIFPDEFIGAAEEAGRIDRLTYFVLDRALEAAASINSGGRSFGIAVNLSALLLTDENLAPSVEALLRKHQLPPNLLTLEVTETSTMASADDALVNLQRLADLGVALSIDDYGTGFSTLDYLKRIPASELKIDRSFISVLCKSQSDRIMVNSTIQLAHSLGRNVVAEGVESEEILREIRKMGCDLAQGYHIARPTTLPQLLEILSAESGERGALEKVVGC